MGRGVRCLARWAVPAALAALMAPAPASAVETDPFVADQVRECANSEREQHGLPRLPENPVLDKAAELQARNMAKYDYFDHWDPWGRGPQNRIDAVGGNWLDFVRVGENIAAGGTTVERTCADWMASHGHRENILDPAWHAIGSAFARGKTSYGYYYVQEFANVNVGGPKPVHKARVDVRLYDAEDRLTLSLDDRELASVRPGESRTLKLGKLDPASRIEVEAFSASGRLSWGIEEHADGQLVYRDRGTRGRPAAGDGTVDLATGGAPLFHRVTIDAHGRVLSLSPRQPARLPRATPRWSSSAFGR